MRCSSAVVLSTLAVGGAAANVHGRHASFHARRQADSKRSAGAEVNWKDVAYDLKNVDWNAINWSSVFASPAAKPTSAPAAPQQQKATPTPTSEAKKEPAATSAAAPVAEKPASSSQAAKPSSSVGDKISNVVDDVMFGVASIANKMGAKVGTNSKTNNGGIWIGSDSAWGMEVTNTGSQQAVFFCWKANGFSGMSINVNVPDISVGLQPNQKVDLSFAPNVPAACAVANSNSKLAMFGGVDDTWAEVTFGEWGAFDVSRNVNMKGSTISMVGSKCTSDMNTCVFKCKNGSDTCEKGTDYDLFNCDASNGGGGGYDTKMAGTGGGCSMGSSSEKIKVSFS